LPRSSPCPSNAPASQTLLVDLSDNALLAITGDDATTFLQGSSPTTSRRWSRPVAVDRWCSPKGRLIATLLLIKRGDGYLAMLPAELAPPIAKRLGMFVLRSKVKIADVSAGHARFGLVGPGAAQAAQEMTGLDVISLPWGRSCSWSSAPRAASTRALRPDAARDWALALIRAGIPTIVAATQDEFVPQMANFDLIGGVSFRKGCYPGRRSSRARSTAASSRSAWRSRTSTA
jgi:folate-binding Fe-S cluster repair protein YgfZ